MSAQIQREPGAPVIPLVRLKPTRSKARRLNQVAPLVQSGRVRFAPHLDPDRNPDPDPNATFSLVGASALFRAASAAYAARTRALDTSLVALATSPPARATAETDALSPAAASARVGTSSKDSNPPNLANSVHTSDDAGTTVDGSAAERRASISRRIARRLSRSLAP